MGNHPMVQVIESTGPVPPEISACGEGAPAYLVVDPGQGSEQGRLAVEEQLRDGYRSTQCIVFIGYHKLDDGRVVSVGSKEVVGTVSCVVEVGTRIRVQDCYGYREGIMGKNSLL